MKRVSRLVLIAVALSAQDLPPEVLLLSRIQAHMRGRFARLPDYTCLETVRRFHKEPGEKGGMIPLDTVLLEILYSQHHDLYSSAGDRQFRSADAASFTSSGMIGNGIFTRLLKNVLLGVGSQVKYRGEETLGDNHAARYEFRLSPQQSGYTINMDWGRGQVGIEGSFWADPKTLEVLRMETRVIESPPFLPVDQSSFQVIYAPMRVGDSVEFLPQSGELHMRELNGKEDRDLFEFTHCRSFQAESQIHFDGDRGPENPMPALTIPTDIVAVAPPLLIVTVRLTSEITDRDPVGTLVNGQVTDDVRRNGEVVVPAGSVVRGRIRRLERVHDLQGYFIVGLELTEIEVRGGWMRFYADLQRITGGPMVRTEITRPKTILYGYGRGVSATETLRLPDLPGVASFFVRGQVRLGGDLRMVWRTRALLH